MKIDIEELKITTRDTQDAFNIAKEKLDSLESSLPHMSRQMVNYYFD